MSEMTREQAVKIINDSPILLSLLYDLNLLPEQAEAETLHEFYMLSVVAHFQRSLAPVQEGKETTSPGWVAPEVRLALKVLLNHVEPGWENCKTVVEAWLEAAAPRKEGE